MDPFTLSIGVAAVVILFTIVYLVSAFASKEKTYEQAVAEHQKLKQPAPTANKDNNKDKKIKDKKDKNKKDKKNKDKGGKSAEVIDERSTEALFKPIVDESKTKEESKIEAKPESVLVSKKDKFASKSSSNKTTGVAASTEPEVFKGISASKKNSDKITKTESNTIILESVPKADKQKQEKSKSKENVDKIGKPIEKREKRTPLTPKGDDSANNSGFFSLENDISIMKLVEVIKTMPLSNEETQVLIDALLSKNTEAPTDWINKNDPITVLKKQLEEKELELKKESENHDRAKTRIQDMREEINQEKQKQVSIKEQLNVNVVKIGQLENKLQQSEELKNAELHKLQNNFAQIRDKLSDDLKLAIQQAQKEEERANQAVNQLEQEKRRLELLNFQVMQYNTDRQHFNGLNSNLEKVNEDMKNENNMLKEQISELKNSYDLNEFKRHQHFSEVEQKLTQCLRESEQKAEAATAQLKHISEEFGDQIEKLKRSLFEAQTQHSALLHEKNALEESQQQLRNELAQVKPNAEDANKAVAELLQELDALKQQLANDTTTNKEHLQQLQQQLVAEREKFVLLEEKVKHYEQTLNKVEQDLGNIGETANDEVNTWNQRLEDMEKQFDNIQQEQQQAVSETA